MYRCKTFFFLWLLCPSEGWAWRRCSCLACRDPGGAKCAGTQTSSTIGVMALSVIFWASCSWWSEFLFGQSFSTALPIQALRGLPCLESISIVQCVRHIEGSLWLRSYSVDQCIRHLKGHPGGVLLCSSVHQVFDGPASLLFSCQCWHVGREELWWWLHSLCVCFYGCLAFLHRYFSPQSPPSHPLDPFLHSQQQPSTIPKLQLPATVPSKGPESLSKVCITVARTLWFSFHLGCHRSAVWLCLKCFSSDSDSCPNVGIGPLLQLPHIPTVGPVLLTLLFFPPSSFVLPSFAWFYTFFSAGQAFLCALSSCSACTSVSKGVFL